MKEVIGDATLYLADCMEILQTLPKVDAVIDTEDSFGYCECDLLPTKDESDLNRCACCGGLIA